MNNSIKEKIIKLNEIKNLYAKNKIERKSVSLIEKEMISGLLYIIEDIKNYSLNLGLKNGKFDILTPEIKELDMLNENVKNLKSQILFLIENDSKEIKKELQILKEKNLN